MRWVLVRWKSLVELLAVVIGGSAPLWWFHPGELMKSTDLRWPTLPMEWPQFLYAWKEQIGTGAESIFDASMILFHGLEALFGLTGWPLARVQQVVFFFWFLASALAMHSLLRVVLTGPYRRVGRLVGVTFYLYNLWQATYWTAYKPPLVVGYALLPAILALLISAFEQQLRWRWVIVGVGGLTVMASAIGNNPTEAAGFLLPVVGCVGLYGWRARRRGILRPLVVLAVMVVGLNAFWWVPQVAAVAHQQGENVAVATARATAENWLEGLSRRTSFANVARLQGEWTWESGVWEPYVPYDHLYQKRVGLWLGGWLIPLLAFCGIVWGPARHKAFFTVTAVLGLILSMGIHPPFHDAYLALTQWVPGFWALRSPYYKFGMMLCLGYAFLLSAAAMAGCRALGRWWRPAVAAIVVGGGVMGLALAYAFPVTTGMMFIPPAQRVRLPPGRVQIPSYVWEAVRWLDAQPNRFRVWSVPGANVWETTWGYTGVSPVLSDFSTHPFVYLYNPILLLTTQAARHPELPLVQMLTDGVRDGQSRWLTRLLPWLNVRYVLFEGDVSAPTYARTGREVDHYVPFIADHLARQHELHAAARHGPWQWYRVTSPPRPQVWAAGGAWIVQGAPTLLWPWSYSATLEQPVAVCFAGDVPPAMQAAWAQAGVLKGTVVDATAEAGMSPGNATMSAPALEVVGTMAPVTVAPGLTEPSPAPPEPPWQWLAGFTAPVRDAQGHAWRWVTDANTNAIGIDNPSAISRWVMLRMGVQSVGMTRSLMLYLNGQLAAAFPIPADQPVMVTTPLIELPPGRSTVRIYTPAAPTAVEGQLRNFALEERACTHAPGVLAQTMWVPQAGRYEAWLAATAPGPVPVPERRGVPVTIDEVLYTFPQAAEDLYGPVLLSLAPGRHTMRIPQAAYESYHYVWRRLEAPPPAPVVPTTFQKISPVEYRAHVEAAGPHILIFQESYDPGWGATVGARSLGVHLPVFGYANGWWVNHGGRYDVVLRFRPQQWMAVGALLSVGTLALGFVGWWRRR